MTPSTTKSSSKLICIHPVPAHLSTREYAVKLEAALDAVLSIPICRENFISHEIMIPNGHGQFDSYFKPLGFEAPQPVIIVKSECKTADHLMQIVEDPEVIKLISGEEFSGASVFTADETIRLDARSSDTCDGSYAIVLKCPPDSSAAEFHEKCLKNGDEILKSPAFQQNVVKHATWIKNEALASHVQPLGLFSAEPLVIVLVQSSLDRMTTMLKESEANPYIAPKDNALKNRFGVDVVVKL
ncbi:hypothetical protein MSAN_00971600 [Mycena sanguinolenta]|uniref:Uncharacterized protein n=1 Tax=Mycena sanguinolenta TaxID=230812 RepID=A0A8H7D9D7_9AGAR|nr:hypothetical protein MSAN_00971600 [Mycena sanguinolenta]